MSDEFVDDITQKEWETMVEKSSLPVAVMFYSPTCAHCHVMEPSFVQYAKKHADSMRFVKVNVMANQYIAVRYGIMGTPTFKFFCHGHPIQELVGEIYPPLLERTIEEVLRDSERCVKTSSRIDYDITGYT